MGGGAVYFHLNSEKAIINDLNSDLMNFYTNLQYHYTSIIKDATKIPNTKESYNNIRKNYPDDLYERAVWYFYINKTCYSGLMRYNSKGGFNTPYGNYKNPNFEITPEQINLIRKTEIFNLDYKKIPYVYKTNDFVFCDPPYVDTWIGYNDQLFNEACQKELHNWFLSNPAQVMIVINKTDLTVKLYERFIKEEYQVKYGIDVKSGNKKIKTHLIITNY